MGRNSSSLQYYVNWRAIVIKLHALLLRVDGLDEILELHRPGSKVRKQVALPSHPTRDLLRSKEMASASKTRAGPVFHRPLFHPIRAVSRSAVIKASEQERKAELLRSRAASVALPVARPLTSSASDARRVSAGPLFPSVVVDAADEADAGVAPASARRASLTTSVVPSSLRRAPVFSEVAPEEATELSSSMPSRYDSHFLSSGPIPPSRLTEAIKLRSDKFVPSSTSSSSSSVAAVAAAAPAEIAPPFRTNLASLEQLTVHPVGRFAQHETQDPPPRVT
jgi:hypothetical protein